MSSEQQEVADLIRSGRYYAEARDWYKTLYIGPISERSFFLLIAGLAAAISLLALLAVHSLLPLTWRPGLIVYNHDVDGQRPSLGVLQPHGASMNGSIEKFFVMQYVVARESYQPTDFAADSAFVRAHSTPEVANQYAALYGPANPRSPANVLGSSGKRVVTLGDIAVRRGSKMPRQVTVKFSTALQGVGVEAKTQWTATLSYYYSPLLTKEGGPQGLLVKDPQFKVVSYAVTQTP